MSIDADTKLFCLIGNPISRSLSPLIHNTIFKMSNVNNRYLAFPVTDLEKAVTGIKALGVKGFNVTIPHKINIIKYLDEIDDKAKIIGAVNTVVNINGKLIGYNTDGDGFIKSLKDKGYSIKGKKTVMVGAGGAAHSIAVSLALEGISQLIIINRTIKNAYNLKALIQNRFPQIHVECYESGIQNNNLFDTDLLINTTSVGMYPNIDALPISPSLFPQNTIIYDIIYKPNKTKLLFEAEKQGNITINGLQMLINQAIYSQYIWNESLINQTIDFIKLEEIITNEVQMENR